MKIVVRMPNWIGDVLFALPAVESLKAAYPGAEVWLAGNAWLKDLIDGDAAERTVILPDLRTWKALRSAARSIKSRNFDLGLLLTNSFSSALLFSRAGIPERWGYRGEGRRFLLTKSRPKKAEAPPAHMVYYYLRLLEGLGMKTVPPEIKLAVPVGVRERARTMLGDLGADFEKRLVLLNPGAAFGPAKRWPASRFAELAQRLQDEKNVQVALTGAAADASTAEAISSALVHKPLNLAGRTTLSEFLGVISHAAVFVTNDTGPMHMANALRVPIVGIFGPTDPRATAPFHAPATVIKKEGIFCWPCLNRECPFDHRCMLEISAAEVFEAAAACLP